MWLSLESEEGGVDEAADQKAMSAIIQALLGCKHSLQGEFDHLKVTAIQAFC